MAIRHYSGTAGEFDYDDTVFTVKNNGYVDNLIKVKEYKGPISLPKGCKRCCCMFWGASLHGCYFEDFDTSEVTNMASMFYKCDIPEEFTLGEMFNTSKVKTMREMFKKAKLPAYFSLGEKFDTSAVENMSEMFCDCALPEGFTLGSNFNTSNVKDISYMFENCIMCDGFKLDDTFDIHRANDLRGMFKGCTLSKTFSVGRDFTIIRNLDLLPEVDTSEMFRECRTADGEFVLGDPEKTIRVLKQQVASYKYSRLLDVPAATLSCCNSDEEFLEIVHKFCKVQ